MIPKYMYMNMKISFVLLFPRRSIDSWDDGVDCLEKDNGEAWKLVFKLLARGRLYNEDRAQPMKMTGRKLIEEHKILFQ